MLGVSLPGFSLEHLALQDFSAARCLRELA